MQSNHTPGPWTIEPLQQTEGADLAIVSPQNGWTVAIIQHDPAIQIEEFPDCESVKWHAEDLGNARLIAEAPAMLEALRAVVALAELHIAERSKTPEEESEFLSCAYLVNARAILARIDAPSAI